VSFGSESFSDVRMHVDSAYSGKLARNSFSIKLQTAVEAIALCHNVTPIDEGGKPTTYQAASPDEVGQSINKCGG
jgi:phospholipid-translocating ATPase